MHLAAQYPSRRKLLTDVDPAVLIGNNGELYEVEKTVKDGVLVVTRNGREEAAGNERRTT
jgi:hypothetical protein